MIEKFVERKEREREAISQSSSNKRREPEEPPMPTRAFFAGIPDRIVTVKDGD